MDNDIGYDSVTVICEGAFEEETIWPHVTGESLSNQWHNFAQWLDNLERETAADGIETEVYILSHGHSPDVDDCACAQYATNHRPDYVFGGTE